MKPYRSDDDVYTIEDFSQCVDSRFLTDYDGFGQAGYEEGCEDHPPSIIPSRFDLEDLKAKGYTHVVWFNR